ncbi:MAG: glycosyltransferase family 39 protein [Sedimentisphaerales bacterium]|nr:glycosyltransferase family 39 protein [Sedimentisphaerales bacterium]
MTKTNPDEYNPASEDTKRRTRRLKTAVYICILLSTLAAYEPIRHNDFVLYDDYGDIIKNTHINNGITRHSVIWAFTSMDTANWFPLTRLSHMLDFELFGANPVGHHLTNVLIHLAGSLLLFLVLLRMTAALWPSAFVAAVFALHPLHVESVAWAAERKDVLSGFFWILTILAYVYYAQRPNFRRYILVLITFAMGTMSKPMVVTLPFVLLLLDYWPLNRFGISKNQDSSQKPSAMRLIAEKIPLFAMSAVLSVVTFIAQQRFWAVNTLESTSLSSRIANAFTSYIRYIQKTVWPGKLAVIYPAEGEIASRAAWILYAAVFILITALCFYIGRRRKYVLVGWLWYVGTLIPVIGLVKVGSHAMADRYMYIPMVGLLIIAGWGSKDLVGNRRLLKNALAVLAGALLLSSIIITRNQITFWQNTLTLFERALNVTTNNIAAEANYADALIKVGRTDEALLHLREAVRIRPLVFPVRLSFAKALLYTGNYEEAIENFNMLTNSSRVRQYKEARTQVFGGLASAQIRLGRYEQAIENLNKVIQIDSKNSVIINGLAWLLATCEDAFLRNPAQAITLAKHACELTEYKDAYTLDTLAAAYASAGKFNEAVTTAQQAIIIAENSKDDKQKKLISEIQKRLDLFKNRQPYIENQDHK